MKDTYPIIRKDILENNSRCLCYYRGQDGEPLSVREELEGLLTELLSSYEGVNANNDENRLRILKSYIPDIKIFEERGKSVGELDLGSPKGKIRFLQEKNKQITLNYE